MKKLYTLICSIIFFGAIDTSAQSGNMWTEIPFGQNLNCLHVDGDYLYFGADFGIVKYNRLTGDKQNITFFNSMHDFIYGIDYLNGGVNFVNAITTDASGNIYAIIGFDLFKYDGFVWTDLGYVYSTGGGQVDLYDLKFIDNKVWCLYNSMSFNYNCLVPEVYYDPATDSIYNYFSTISGNYNPLCINNDGTLWTEDANFSGIGNDSAHLVKLDLSGNVLDDRYVNASFNYFGSYQNFLIEGPSGKLYYIKPNTNLSVNDGSTVTNYAMPTGNFYDFKETGFDPSGNLFMLGASQNYGNISDKSKLLMFNGTTVTEYSDVQFGSPYHRFSDMDFDNDGNLWLACNEHNNRSIQENVFKKTPANVWSRFYLNDYYLPGTHLNNYTKIGSDAAGKAYFIHDNALSIIDSNLNVSFVQFYDSLVGDQSYGNGNIYGSDVSPNGIAWFITYFPYRLYKIQNSVITYFTNFPQAGEYNIIASSNSKVYINFHPTGTSNQNRIYSFDGISWQLIPITGLPANTSISYNSTYDAANNKLWYSISDTNTNDVYLVSFDGTANTVFNSSTLPWFNGYNNFKADDVGNIWCLNNYSTTNDSVLIKWDGVTSTYYSTPNGTFFGFDYFQFLRAGNGKIVLKGPYYDPFNYSQSESILEFDGSNWNIYLIPDNVQFYSDVFASEVSSYCVEANGKYFFELANEIVVYQPTGTPNMPGATYNLIAGNIFYDMNSNNIYDTGDLQSQGIGVQSDNYSAISDWFGNFELHTDTGMQSIQSVTPPYYISAPANYSHNFHDSVSLGISNIDFALQPIPGINDLTIDVSAWGFRPGHNGTYYLNYKNTGTTTLTGILTLNFDSQLNFTGAYPSASSIAGNTVTWNLGSLAPFAQGMIHVSMWVDSTIVIGTVLNSVMQITPVVNDTTPLNNLVNYSHTVIASWDPNEKTVTPAGVGAANIVDTAQDLTYTIFFQNTGTDTAFNITVFDTLDTNVDVSTFKLIASSHPVQFYFQNPNIIKFVFNNILLPDSNVNEPGSHGFVKYSIEPKSGTEYGDTIQNTGYIYFDYNAPVVTNTTLNTLGDPLSVFELSNGNQLQLILYPNPNSGKFSIEISSTLSYQNLKLEITDCSGRILKSDSFVSSKTEVDCKNFSAGVYFVKVLSGDKVLGTAKYVLMK